MNKKTIEQVAKCAVGWNQKTNGGTVKFNKKFLSYYDNFELRVVSENDEEIELKLVMKKGE